MFDEFEKLKVGQHPGSLEISDPQTQVVLDETEEATAEIGSSGFGLHPNTRKAIHCSFKRIPWKS